MNEIWIAIIGAISTISGVLITYFTSKKKNNAEAANLQIDSYAKMLELDKNQMDYLKSELGLARQNESKLTSEVRELNKQVTELKSLVSELQSQISALQEELSKYKIKSK